MARRVLLVHNNPFLLDAVRRACQRHHTTLLQISSQSELLEVLSVSSSPFDLAIIKDVGPDWFSVAGTLLASRAFGVLTPFLVIADPSDSWTKRAVETGGSAAFIDERTSRWLVPLLVDDWLDGLEREHQAASLNRSPVQLQMRP